jgi:TonB-linked SusC/RagA family outer membrane protein
MKNKFLVCLVLFVLGMDALYAQQRQLSGIVKSKTDNIPLPGVTIRAKGSSTGTITNNDGYFNITLKGPVTSLIISSIGFLSKEVSLGTGNSINVFLETDAASLSEVVVTGYGNQLRERYTGSAGKVDSKSIENIPMATFDQILQGRSPGLYVTAGSGQPGTSARVTIRGIGSINGTTSPLYILDGVPIESGAFSTINPNDIETVDILKDASATAIYGSRGSNGVIVVNTKRGKAGSLKFGYSTQVGFSNRTTPRFEVLNSQQRIQFEEEVGLENNRTIGPGWTLSAKNPANGNLSATQKSKNQQILDSLSNSNVNWTDIFFRTGSFQQHEVNASGGSDKVRFYTSANYYKQNGTALNSYLERYTFRNNLDFNSNRFSSSINTTIGYSNSSFITNENTTSILNPFASVYYALPYEQPYVNGTLINSGNLASSPYTIYDYREGSDALERVQNSNNRSNQLKGTLSGKAGYQITNDLSASTLIGIDFRETNSSNYINPNSYSGSTVTNGRKGSFGEGLTRNFQLVSTSALRFAKNINDKHNIDIQGIFELTKNSFKNFSYTGYGINPKLPETPAGITPGSATGFIPVLGGSRTRNLLASFILNGGYTYDNKYTLNASYRYDGTSTIPESNRWKGFYSFGANWNIKREDFLKDTEFLSGLRLRGSYGLTASPFNANFAYISTYSNARYAGVTGVVPSSPGNADYDWEYTKQTDIGIDFELWKNRVRAIVDIYNKDVENLFINQSLSATAGFSSLQVNAGSLYNRGIEASLQVDVIKNNDFKLTLGANANYNKNKITDLGQVTEFISGTSIIRVGLPLGTHYLPEWAGVDPQTGNPQYYNLDGSITTTYDRTAQSAAKFGSYQPTFQGGFNASIDYKGIFLEAFFVFANNVTRFNNEDYFNENASFGTSNQSTLVLERWRKAGDITNVQRYGSTRQFSSKDLQDASYLRFRNFTLGYRLPEGLLKKSGFIKGAVFTLQGQNLYTWTSWRGFDPEDNNNIAAFEYPNARTYTFGINLNF